MDPRKRSPRRPARPTIDTERFVHDRGELSARQAPDELPRLRELLADGDGWIEWRLSGERRPRPEGGSEAFLRLSLSGSVGLTCVRCLEPVRAALAEARLFKLALTETEAEREDAESEGYDVLAANPRFDVLGLVEDEAILALPIAPRHEDCRLPAGAGRPGAGPGADAGAGTGTDDRPGPGEAARAGEAPSSDAGDGEVRPNPFAVLARLKRPDPGGGGSGGGRQGA